MLLLQRYIVCMKTHEKISNDKDQEIRYIHRQTVWFALRGHIFHLSICADDAIPLEIRRRVDRQGTLHGNHG